ncbi:MAG: ABC transporter permease [Bacteroidota bacterium]|nr:ABC transporter permease [Bacteroidota bacterium]
MLKKILNSFSLAVNNIRSRIFHTLLSVLGIIIGVAALVAILSLIDGMEKYAHAQITKTTSLTSVVVQTETHKQVDNIWVKKENYEYIDYNKFHELQKFIASPIKGSIGHKISRELNIFETGKTIGANIYWHETSKEGEGAILYGHHFTPADKLEKNKVAIINKSMASAITGNTSYIQAIDRPLVINSDTFSVVGVLADNEAKISEAFLPITLLGEEEYKENPPLIIFEAEKVEDVAILKDKINEWVLANYKNNDIKLITNEFRLQQAAEGFLLFRLIMGMIVGISVIVGGIGVMNVLLISVTERTVEIGIRKAMGAKKQDILLQFLSESITIAVFGSALGILIGIASTFVFVPIIKIYANIPFQAAFTFNTLLIISVVAILIGIIFGTYPAMKAAKLDPVEAIRKE